MPETPVLAVWNTIRALHCGKTSQDILSFNNAAKNQTSKCRQKITDVLYTRYSLRGRKRGILGACVHLCQSVPRSSSGEAREQSWPWTSGWRESNQRDVPRHTTAVVFTASPQTLDTNDCLCARLYVRPWMWSAGCSHSVLLLPSVTVCWPY